MSCLENLPGNPKVKTYLKKLLKNPPQTLLFEGPKGIGKGEFARVFAKMLLKSEKKEHPDFREIFPEGKAYLHPMHTIRECIKEIEMLPFEAKCKVFLIHDADRMLSTSMNALLKTLEEPILTSIIILITSHPQALLPTITSRSFIIPFSPLTVDELESYLLSNKIEKEQARKIALLSHGSLEKALVLSNSQETLSEKIFDLGVSLLSGDYLALKEYKELQNAEEVLSYLFYFYRDLHLLKIGADSSYLFYRDKEETLKNHLTSMILPLEEIQERIEKIHKASELHIPLNHSLCALFN